MGRNWKLGQKNQTDEGAAPLEGPTVPPARAAPAQHPTPASPPYPHCSPKGPLDIFHLGPVLPHLSFTQDAPPSLQKKPLLLQPFPNIVPCEAVTLMAQCSPFWRGPYRAEPGLPRVTRTQGQPGIRDAEQSQDIIRRCLPGDFCLC